MLQNKTVTCIKPWLAAVLLGSGVSLHAQTVLFQEGFETDGAGTRYTVTGGDAYEVPRIQSELNIQDQLGPIYWARNTEVSFVGVPGATPERRALLYWHHTIDPSATPISAEFLDLFESTVNWLTRNKTSGTVLWSAEPSLNPGDTFLMEKLTEMGFSHQTDVTSQALPPPNTIALAIKTSSGNGGNSSRFSTYAVPMLAYNAADHDDELISSIGQSALSIDIPNLTIAAEGHQAAGGLTGEIPLTTGGPLTFDTIGEILPENATVIATFERSTPFVANTLELADQIVNGTLASTKETNTLIAVDIGDPTTGAFFYDSFPPGTPSDSYVLRATGRIQVSAAGTYRFALGVDDGGRFRIDTGADGFTEADNVVVVDSTGAFRWTVQSVQLNVGTYDFEVIMFDQGGDAGLELAVATSELSDPNNIAFGDWELIGEFSPVTAVTLQGSVTAVAYSPQVDPIIESQPFLALLPAGDEGGLRLSGGPFVGYEGAAFWGASGLNKWPFPAGDSDRKLRLNPIDLVGKTDLYLTFSAAATFLDFETSDFLDVYVDPDGTGPQDFQRLVRFSAPTGNDKYFDDRGTDAEDPTRLGLRFRDVTYKLPDGLTQAVIEFRAFTSWWNEIVAFDNIRITEGAPVAGEEPTIAISKDQTGIIIEFTGTLEMTTDLPGGWGELQTTANVFTIPFGSLEAKAFFRSKQ